MAMGFFYYGLRDTTATYATNFLNLIPIVTFLFSTVLRIEKLHVHTSAGKIKIFGASLCLGGALTIALYKGEVIQFSHRTEHHKVITNKIQPNWTRGTIFLVCSCVSYGMWFITQAKLVKVFPHRYWATMLTCIIASAQNAVIGICVDRRKSSWHLGWNLQLVAIVYSGVLATAATFCLISWAVAKRGPTYPSMFNPLSLIFIAISEAFFLDEEIATGCLVGMALIIVGLYSFLWGKKKELENMKGGGEKENGEVAESKELQLTSSVVIPVTVPVDSPTLTANSTSSCST